MENFIVSARKYRPNTFATVVGQDSITTTLKNAIKNNHLAQAFLFCGPRGVGKTTCARILAKTINCENLSENVEACDKCESCTSFNQSASFNIHELDAASNNSVDDIRNLVDQVRIPPQVGKYKVYIIDEVHMLSAAAFNAFLKTLEEPPAYAKFILATTEKHKIIPTILSRCQIYNFHRITVEDIANHLAYVAKNENIQAEEDALHIISQKADGALRDALSIFDQLVNFAGDQITYETVIENLNVLDYDYYFKITDYFLKGDIANSLLLINDIIELGFDGHHFITGLGEHFRNLLVCQDNSTVKLLEVGANIKANYLHQSNSCTLPFLLTALDIANKADVAYKNSTNKRLQLEVAIMQLCTLSKQKTELKKPDLTNVKVEATKTYVQQNILKPTSKVSEPSLELRKEEPELIKTETEPPKPPDDLENPKLIIPESNERDKTIVKPKVGTVSINDMISKSNIEENNKPEEEVESDYVIPIKPINSEELANTIKKYADEIKIDKSAFAATLNNHKPELLDNNNVVLTLDNKVQDDKSELNKLLGFIKKELDNNQIKLQVKIIKKDDIQKAYTTEDKFKKMAKKNPALVDLKAQLDLDI